jgi:glycosyltransferase involved in cell wall biosynthesis
VTLVSAETFEYDSRGRRMVQALAADGHSVRVLAVADGGLPLEEEIDGVRVTRLELDRRITSALRPLPVMVRNGLAAILGMDADAVVLPATTVRGLDRLRYPLRRLLEVWAQVRRVGPWIDAVARAAPDTDVFHTQALMALPVVRQAARRANGRYVYDFADYQTEAGRIARMPGFMRALVRRRERGWAGEAAGMLAVSEPMADLVMERFATTTRPSVVLNCPPSWRPDVPGPPASTRLRDALGLPADRQIVLHHGQFKQDRGIEQLVGAADHPLLRELNAAIVLVGFGRLRERFEEAARQRPGRIYVLPAVPVSELLEWVSGADVCYLGCPPVTLNLRLTIPNKVFEAMMAGVPVVAAAGTEQARLIEREAIGKVVDIDGRDELAGAIAGLMAMPAPERLELRQRCRTLALNSYSWEVRSRPLVDLFRRI